MLRPTFFIGLIGTIVLVQGVARQLAAAEPPASMEVAMEKIREMEASLADLVAQVEDLETRAEVLEDTVDRKIKQVKAMAERIDSLSPETRRRADLLRNGQQAGQQEAVAGADTLGDEGVLLLSAAAGMSPHQAVRRRALQIALRMGEAGYPVFVHAFEELPDEDRLFLIERLAGLSGTDGLIALAKIAAEGKGEVHEAAVKAGTRGDHRVLFAATLVAFSAGEHAPEMIKLAGTFEGQDGLLLLYSAARYGEPEHITAALAEAGKRKPMGLVVVAPAFQCEQPKVRAAIVRCAKKIGGEYAKLVIEQVLAESNDNLREAAEQALKQDGGA